MAILLLFNEADQLSYREIAVATEIPPADLKRSLQVCLAMPAVPCVCAGLQWLLLISLDGADCAS